MWNLSRVDVYVNNNSKRFLLSTLKYENEGGRYLSSDIGFYLIMQRGSMYSMINNVFPCLVLNVVILAAFFIPVILSLFYYITSFNLNCYFNYISR